MEFLRAHRLDWRASPDATDAEKILEFSGRICYLSFDPNPRTKQSTQEYIKKLIKNEHESVLEHAQWTFLLDSVSRGFSHQLVRHRVGFSFSQLSQQYHDETDVNFLRPRGLDEHEELKEKWDSIQAKIHEFYRISMESALPDSSMSDREMQRCVRSFARALLPNAMRTMLSVTANARSLRHFLQVRGGLIGDIEMRQVSVLIYDMLCAEAPAVVFDFVSDVLDDGTPIILKNEQ